MIRRCILIKDMCTKASAMVSGFMLIILIIINSYGVIMRYVINNPVDWVMDVSEFLMAGSVFLGAAYIYRLGRHVSVDLVVGTLPEKPRQVLAYVANLFVLVFVVFLTWKTAELAWMNLYALSSSVVRFPMFPGYFLVSLGSFLLLLECLGKLFTSDER